MVRLEISVAALAASVAFALPSGRLPDKSSNRKAGPAGFDNAFAIRDLPVDIGRNGKPARTVAQGCDAMTGDCIGKRGTPIEMDRKGRPFLNTAKGCDTADAGCLDKRDANFDGAAAAGMLLATYSDYHRDAEGNFCGPLSPRILGKLVWKPCHAENEQADSGLKVGPLHHTEGLAVPLAETEAERDESKREKPSTVQTLPFEFPGWYTPAVAIPGVEIPGMQTGDMEIPDIHVPELNIPKISIPAMELLATEAPMFTIPGFSIPSIDIPATQFPDLQFPDLLSPELAVPALSTPAIAIPKIDMPDIELPTSVASELETRDDFGNVGHDWEEGLSEPESFIAEPISKIGEYITNPSSFLADLRCAFTFDC